MRSSGTHLRRRLPLAVDAPVALFEARGVPGEVEVEEVGAVGWRLIPSRAASVHTRMRSGSRAGSALKRSLDIIAVLRVVGLPVEGVNAPVEVHAAEPRVELLYEVALCVDVLGEDDQPTPVPARRVEHVLADPPEQVTHPRIGPPRVRRREPAELVEQRHGIEAQGLRCERRRRAGHRIAEGEFQLLRVQGGAVIVGARRVELRGFHRRLGHRVRVDAASVRDQRALEGPHRAQEPLAQVAQDQRELLLLSSREARCERLP
jgi:hypothetical protein